MRIQGGPVLPGLRIRDLLPGPPGRKLIGNACLWEVCLSWKANLHVCVCVPCMCVCVHVCVRGRGSFPGLSLVGLVPSTLPPMPAQALALPRPRCQRSPSRLLWQMFGCAMATPEQDVPLDHSEDQPTCPGRPRVPLPKGLMGGTVGDPGRDEWCLHGREAEPASSLGSVAGEGRTHVHIPAESLLVQGACDCSSLSFGAILRELGGKGGWQAAGLVRER